jgi:septal ring factor EnvC (AmiA/AmiB activator)
MSPLDSAPMLQMVSRAVLSLITGVDVRAAEARGTFDDRVADASKALRDAAATVAELEDEIQARQTAVARLEQQRKVLEVDREQVEAIAGLLNENVRADSNRAMWIGLGSNALFFVLGIVVTMLIG